MKKVIEFVVSVLGGFEFDHFFLLTVALAIGLSIAAGNLFSHGLGLAVLGGVFLLMPVGVLLMQELVNTWAEVAYEGQGTLHLDGYFAHHSAPGTEARVWVDYADVLRIPTIIRFGNANYLSGLAKSHQVELLILRSPLGKYRVKRIRFPALGKVIEDGEWMVQE